MNKKPSHDEFRQLEEKLKIYQSLVNNSPDLLYRTDLNGLISFISPSVFELSGYTVEEATGMNIAEEAYLYPEERQTFLTKLQENGVIKNFVAQLKRKDGSVWWGATNARFIKDDQGKVLGVEGITRDVSELKEKENALRVSEERFRLAFHTNPDAINLSKLSDGILVDVNEGFSELTGFSREETIGKSSLSISVWNDPEDRKKLVDALSKSNTVKNMETRLVRKNGSVMDCLLSACLIQINNEKYIQSITKDITETKILQKQLLLNQKLEAIGTLAGGIAHDFNNILGAIFGFAQLISINAEDSTKVKSIVGKLYTAGNQAKRLVQQILDFSRQGNLEKIPTDIRRIVKEAMKLINVSLPLNVDVRMNIKRDLGYVQANPEQLHQVIMNLCVNASQAMHKNGGILNVELNQINIGIDDISNFPELMPGKYLQLTVADNGHGMDSKTVSRIFEPFFTTKKKGVGTGMGLSTAQGIVKNHGGKIIVHSELDVGTTFHVFLPKTEKEGQPSLVNPEILPKGNEQILFVDDEEFLAEIGKDMLEKLGYTVHTKSESPEALKTFQKNPDQFDLAIIDFTMPGMTGDQLAKKIKEIRKNIPIIMCSGFGTNMDSQLVQKTGVYSILMKPLTMQDLATTVRKALDQTIVA